VGVLAGLHFGDEDAAAVVAAGDANALALLEGDEGRLQGGPQHRPGAEAELRHLAPVPGVAVRRLVAVLLERLRPLVAGGEKAGEAQRLGGLLALRYDAGGESGGNAFQRWDGNGIEVGDRLDGNVPDYAGVGGPG